MEDVFDTSGSPPDGWMNAIFDGGPFHDDVAAVSLARRRLTRSSLVK